MGSLTYKPAKVNFLSSPSTFCIQSGRVIRKVEHLHHVSGAAPEHCSIHIQDSLEESVRQRIGSGGNENVFRLISEALGANPYVLSAMLAISSGNSK
jgi:hypothetical protein